MINSFTYYNTITTNTNNSQSVQPNLEKERKEEKRCISHSYIRINTELNQ
jgi:hypothetical protein